MNYLSQKVQLDRDQIRVLDEMCIGQLRRVNPKKVHDFVWLPEAYYDEDNEKLVFFNVNAKEKDARKLLYYTGNEHDAEIEALWSGVLIYEEAQIREGWLDEEVYDIPGAEEEPEE